MQIIYKSTLFYKIIQIYVQHEDKWSIYIETEMN